MKRRNSWFTCMTVLVAAGLVAGCAKKDNPTAPVPTHNVTYEVSVTPVDAGQPYLQRFFIAYANNGSNPGDGLDTDLSASNHTWSATSNGVTEGTVVSLKVQIYGTPYLPIDPFTGTGTSAIAGNTHVHIKISRDGSTVAEQTWALPSTAMGGANPTPQVLTGQI